MKDSILSTDTNIPILLLIINQNHFVVYSRQFEYFSKLLDEEKEKITLLVRHVLFGNFDSNTNIEIVKFEDNCVIFDTIDKFIVAYVFKGDEKLNRKILNKFESSLSNNNQIFEKLSYFTFENEKETLITLNKYIDESFVL